MGDPEHPAELAIVTMPGEIDITNVGRVGEELAAALTPADGCSSAPARPRRRARAGGALPAFMLPGR